MCILVTFHVSNRYNQITINLLKKKLCSEVYKKISSLTSAQGHSCIIYVIPTLQIIIILRRYSFVIYAL